MPNMKLNIPRFASEAEDAKWHERHRPALERCGCATPRSRPPSAACRRINVGCTMSIMSGEPPWEFDWDAGNVRRLAAHRITRSEFEQAMQLDPIIVDFSRRDR